MWPIRPPHWGPLRKWGYWLGTWSLRRDINRSFKFLLPLIRSRAEKLQSNPGEPEDQPLDMVQGLLEMEIPSPEEGTPVRHAHRVLHLTFAASAVSSALILHTIHQTLMTPQYIPELRCEIAKALDWHGGWTERALLSMHFLDSYIREMLRLCPPSVCKFTFTTLSIYRSARISPVFYTGTRCGKTIRVQRG
jgi:aspirochlorine biosynthesis cytochrome P450 monooxygenase